ncbi:4554_t:CDS:2 [Cetraspora pellucida]|uniref:4554_t:CDS:1 n=1 Tax=Cetraspora pellucida TaxID=1433469 RepID=A0A9N9NFH1_9GLOM|nr:4554_t:CDS:2 [Cetraspora pellucida]
MSQLSRSSAFNKLSIPTISSLSTSYSPLITLPPEIFLNICRHLPPFDLFSLSRVCRLFYHDLCLGESVTIQEIWRQSRLVFMPYRQMGPPEGMNEKEYVRFLVEDKCYFCGRRNKNSRIYWERGIMPKHEEFKRLTSQECLAWMEKQRSITEQIEKEMDLRFFEDVAAKKVQKTERKHAIDAKINELCLEMNENGTRK